MEIGNLEVSVGNRNAKPSLLASHLTNLKYWLHNVKCAMHLTNNLGILYNDNIQFTRCPPSSLHHKVSTNWLSPHHPPVSFSQSVVTKNTSLQLASSPPISRRPLSQSLFWLQLRSQLSPPGRAGLVGFGCWFWLSLPSFGCASTPPQLEMSLARAGQVCLPPSFTIIIIIIIGRCACLPPSQLIARNWLVCRRSGSPPVQLCVGGSQPGQRQELKSGEKQVS